MASTLKLDILTPHGPKRENLDVAGVEVPGLLGEMGVLPEHEPFITAVTPGVVRFREQDRSVRIAVGAGFLEVTDDDRLVVLVERAMESDEVDAQEAGEKLRDAKRQLDAFEGAVSTAEFRSLAHEHAWLQAQVRAAGGQA